MNYHNPAPAGMLSGIPFDAFEDSSHLQRDIHYMKQYYPNQIRLLAEITELVADRYDTPRSFFYDEFPDRISTLHIIKEVKDAYQTESVLTGRQTELDDKALSAVTELLLLQEILLRRMKKRSKKTVFFR